MDLSFLSDNCTEAEAMDDGGDYVVDFDEDENSRISIDRDKRLRRLVGKYIIVCDSRNDKGLLYLQDQTISTNFKGHYWTVFMDNARGFAEYTQAKIKCGNLRYNKPRVRYVDSNFSLKIPKEDK